MELVAIVYTIFTVVIMMLLFTLTTLWMFPHLIITIFVEISILTSQFKKKCITVDESTWCSYLERGSIETTTKSILFIHGFGGSAVDFATICSHFDRSFHLVALDLANHGYSSAYNHPVGLNDMVGFIKMFCERHGLRRKFHLVGYSMGGAVSATFAAACPENIATLSLLNAATFKVVPPTHDGHNGAVCFKSNDQFKDMVEYLSCGTVPPFPDWLVTGLRYHKNRTADRMKHVFDGMPKANFLSHEVIDGIKNLPIFIIWGKLDKICPVENVDLLLRHFPAAKVRVFPDCSHLILLSHMKEFAEQLKSWINEETS